MTNLHMVEGAYVRRQSKSRTLMRMGEASAEFGISHQTLRQWDSDGKIRCARTPAGTRLVERASLMACLGLGIEQEEVKGSIVLYCRVSSASQRQSLRNQIGRMLEWVQAEYNVTRDEILLVREVSSAFGARAGLSKVVNLMLDGKVSLLIAEHQDRLSRTASELELLKHLASNHGCQFKFSKKTIEDESDNAMMVRELIDFITFYTNKISSRKAKDICTVEIPEKTKQRIAELNNQGHSQLAIA